MPIKTVIIDITQDGFDLDPKHITIVKDEGFNLVSNWPTTTNVTNIELSIVHVLFYDSSTKSYAPDNLATADWIAHRFRSRILTRGNPQRLIQRRGLNNKDSDHPNHAHRLIKLKAKVHFQNGPQTVVDPIWDERPGN